VGSLRSGTSVLPSTSEAPAEGPSTNTIDRARFVQRVSGALRSAHQRDGKIQLRLSPPDLGSPRIEITVRQGVVTAHLETETTAARTALLDNLPALRERLAEQEIRIEKFDVDVRRDGGQQNQHHSAAEGRQPQRSPSSSLQPSSPTLSMASDETEITEALVDGSLDVRIQPEQLQY